MEPPAPVAQMPVRQKLERVHRPDAAQHPTLEEHQPRMLEHPHLAAVLVLRVARRLLERERLGVVHRALAALDEAVRKRHVVPVARVDIDPVLPPHGVDRPVPAVDRAERRLLLAHPHLVAPVQPLAVLPVRCEQPQLATHVRHLRIGEASNQQPQRVRLPGRVRVRERHDLRVRLPHREVLRCDLPAARTAQQRDARLPRSERLDQRIGPVGRRIRGDDHVEELGRVVLREQILEPALDHRLLVVGGHDHRHARRPVGRGDRSPAHAREQSRGERIADMRPDDQSGAHPEHDLEDEHGSTVTARQAPTTRHPAPRAA